MKLTYSNYKEPLQKVDNGFGYIGTIGSAEDGSKIQCHICGSMFVALGQHVRQAHKLSAHDYKAKFQLGLTTSLESEGARKVRMSNYQNLWSEERKDKLRRISHDIGRNSGAKKGHNPWHLERRNREGKCPDQVLKRVTDLAAELGRTPSYLDFTAKYGHEFMGPIRTLYGGWTKVVRAAGMIPVNEANTFDRVQMLVAINDFRFKYGREPLWSDFKRNPMFPDTSIYHRVFGGEKAGRRTQA